jgi:hypothetical protein
LQIFGLSITEALANFPNVLATILCPFLHRAPEAWGPPASGHPNTLPSYATAHGRLVNFSIHKLRPINVHEDNIQENLEMENRNH